MTGKYGIHLTRAKKNRLLSDRHGMEIAKGLALTPASEVNVKGSLELLWRVEGEKRGGELELH